MKFPHLAMMKPPSLSQVADANQVFPDFPGLQSRLSPGFGLNLEGYWGKS